MNVSGTLPVRLVNVGPDVALSDVRTVLPMGLDPLPAAPKTLARYLTWLARHRGLKPATIVRRSAAVRYVHQISGHASPTDDILVKATIRGIRRKMGTASTQKTALTAKMIGRLPRYL